MNGRQVVSAACLVFTLGLTAGICVIIWKETSDDDDSPAHPAPVTQVNLSHLATLDIRHDQIDLNFHKLSNEPTEFSSSAILAKGLHNNTELILTDSWEYDGNLDFRWEDGSSLHLQKLRVNDVSMDCMNVQWNMPNGSMETPKDCFDMKESFWFGGFEEASQFWPINKESIPSAPFVTGDGFLPHNIGDVIEGLFVSSSGVGIYVHENSTSYLSVNESNSQLLCLYGRIGNDTPYFNVKEEPMQSYDICQASNIIDLWKGMAKKYLPTPMGTPSDDVLRYPIWSTWARYKADVNQTNVLEFADEIKTNSFEISQLELDDKWTSNYGDFMFDKDKFPNAKEMISTLTSHDIPLTVWMHPFFNEDSSTFEELSHAGLLVKSFTSDEPALTQWWRGNQSGILDLTNPKAIDWYLNKTKSLQKEFNVTSFKFDGGETHLLPEKYRLENPVVSPNFFSKLYAQMAFESDTKQRRQEVRTGFRSQHLPILVRMMDRDSNWGYHKGLKTLIPCALTMGLMGYPFVLPDMIGGNAYDSGDIDKTVIPDPELFVRWLQATTLMPSIQFSIPPWSYNDTVISISRKFTALHASFADKIIALAKNAAKTGEPILRPIWWLAPDDSEALKIDSEFMLGNDVLVAPVLDSGKAKRDIYLPAGIWRYDSTGQYERHSGPKWLRDFPADLDTLPYFTKIHFEYN